MTNEYSTDYRARMLAGACKLADVVKVTMGPKGRYVAMHQKANVRGAEYRDRAEPNSPVLITNDGATVAKSLVLADVAEEMGVRLMREIAETAKDEVGDGSTTAVVLAQSLLENSMRNIEAGADSGALRRGIQAALKVALEKLQELAQDASDIDTLTQVATISCKDVDLARFVAEATQRVGVEGVVSVEESQRIDTSVDYLEGITFDRGFVDPNMALDELSCSAKLYDPYILFTDASFSNPQDLLPFLIIAAEDEHPALVICDNIEGEALGTVLRNKVEGDLDIVCVQAPLYGEGRRWRLEDMALQTGGVFVTEELGIKVRDVTREMIGRAQQAHISRNRTTITGPCGDPQLVKMRENELRQLVENTDYEFNRQRHRERLAAFVSGVARIQVGGHTEPEMWERKRRVEDAACAARAALTEGIVAGGGAALISLVPSVIDYANTLEADERVGAHLLAQALHAPAKQIAENAGVSASWVVARLLEMEAGTGYDAAHNCFTNMLEAGIVDPVRVTRYALTSACSVATTFLGVGGAVAGKHAEEKREDRA